jgi:hypothetical protein
MSSAAGSAPREIHNTTSIVNRQSSIVNRELPQSYNCSNQLASSDANNAKAEDRSRSVDPKITQISSLLSPCRRNLRKNAMIGGHSRFTIDDSRPPRCTIHDPQSIRRITILGFPPLMKMQASETIHVSRLMIHAPTLTIHVPHDSRPPVNPAHYNSRSSRL